MPHLDYEPIPLILPTTDAVTVPSKFAVAQELLNAAIFAPGMVGGTESVAILYSVDKGETFVPAQEKGDPVVLDETNNETGVFAPVLVGVTKTATAAPVGVFLFANQLARQS